MRRSDDTIVRFLTRPLPDGATLIAFIDISDSRRVERALLERAAAFEEADNLKTEFVQNISYQLRTPLQTIQGYAEVLSQNLSGPLNERQTSQVGVILEASTGLSSLIDNVLDMAMVDAGRMELELSEVDVATAINDAANLAGSQLKNVDVPIRVDVAKNVGTMQADEKRVKQILFNLLSNALRFTAKGDEIVVGAKRDAHAVTLWVSDTGRGMAYETQAGAFDTFSSGDRRGAGLGLALVRSFVELHGGRVELESTPGKGTKVTCVLPIEATQEADEPKRALA
jgi:signal transduction histidine kinase